MRANWSMYAPSPEQKLDSHSFLRCEMSPKTAAFLSSD